MPGVPVILLVGTFEPFDTDKASVVGADRHLKKPFDSQDLLNVARELTGADSGAPTVEMPAPEAAPFAAIGGAATVEVIPLVPTQAFPPVIESKVSEPAPLEEIVPLVEPVPLVQPISMGLDSGAFETLSELDAGPEPAPTLEAFAPSIESRAREEVPLVLEETGGMSAPVFEDATAVASEATAPDAATSEPAAPEAGSEVAAMNGSTSLSEADVERIAKRVIELAGESVLREVAWEVVPDLAEVVIKERIRELESQVE
jgi:hypothetical protein